MMEKRNAHARPKQQMGEVMRVYLHGPDYPPKSAINPIKDEASVGTTRLKASLHTDTMTDQWRWTLLRFKFKRCQRIFTTNNQILRRPLLALFVTTLLF